MNCVTCSYSFSFFNQYQYQLTFLQTFLKLPPMLIQELIEILQDLNEKNLNIFILMFWKRQLKILYQFWDKNHAIHQNLLFQILHELLLRVICICNIFHIYLFIKIFFFRQWYFIKLFPFIHILIRVNIFS